MKEKPGRNVDVPPRGRVVIEHNLTAPRPVLDPRLQSDVVWAGWIVDIVLQAMIAVGELDHHVVFQFQFWISRRSNRGTISVETDQQVTAFPGNLSSNTIGKHRVPLAERAGAAPVLRIVGIGVIDVVGFPRATRAVHRAAGVAFAPERRLVVVTDRHHPPVGFFMILVPFGRVADHLASDVIDDFAVGQTGLHTPTIAVLPGPLSADQGVPVGIRVEPRLDLLERR